jgi:hypothetical protein
MLVVLEVLPMYGDMPKLRETREALRYQAASRKASSGQGNDLGYGNNAKSSDDPQPSPSAYARGEGPETTMAWVCSLWG